MSMTKTYRCDICRESFSNVGDAYGKLFGVYFKNNTDFEFEHLNKTDGVHICVRCAVQLKRELNRESVIESIKKAAPVQQTTTA